MAEGPPTPDAERPPAALLAEVLERFGCDPDGVQVFKSFTSVVLGARCGGRGVILKIAERSFRTEEEMAAEIDFVRHLAAEGVPVASPVASVRGRYVEPLHAADRFAAYAFERVEGDHFDCTKWTPGFFRRLGELTACIHRMSRTYRPPSPHRRRTWDEHYGRLSRAAEADRVLAELRSLSRDAGSFGLLHGDLNAWNVLDDAGVMTAIDFENSYCGWFADDIAASLYYTTHDRKYWFEKGAYAAWSASQGIAADDEAFQAYFLRGFLQGYRAVTAFDADWELRIPLFLELRRLSDPDFS